MIVSPPPRGALYLRSILSMARARNGGEAVSIAHNFWGPTVAGLTKGMVDAGGIGSGGWGAVLATPEAAEFWAVVEQASIVGKLAGLRTVPLNVRTQLIDSGFTAYWTASGKSVPLSLAAVSGDVLEPLKVSALAVVTREFVQSSSPQTEVRFRADMVRSLAEAIDAAFVDPANAGVAEEQPASVTFDVTPLTSAGDPATDIAALVAAFAGDFTGAAFITDPVTAATIALARDSGGGYLFPDCGPKGGSLLNIPLIASRSSPRDSSGGQLVLLDASGIAYGAEGVRAMASTQASLEMVDDASDPPTASMVSMYATNSVAILSQTNINWKVVRSNAVALVAGCSYPTAVA